jgi:hypothetical protein
MKYLITEKQYNTLLEQKVSSPTSLMSENPIFGDVVKLNKKFFGLPVNSQITPEYTKKIDDVLTKNNVSASQRTLLGSLSNLIPVWETYLDVRTIVDGIITGNLAKINGGIVGLSSPLFSYKAIGSLMGYFAEKFQGKESADYYENAVDEIVNMGQSNREKLFKKYGYGYYEKWVKAGKPKI